MRMHVALYTKGLSEQQEIHALMLSSWTLRCSHSSAQRREHMVLYLQPKGQVQNNHNTSQSMVLGKKELKQGFPSSTQPPWCGLLPRVRIRDSSNPVCPPKKPPELSGCNRTCCLTDIWASDVTSNVFKETLNTFKVNLITSCYPEKAKYRKNKDLTCTCIYYGQLMLTECFALILDLH